MSRPHDIVLWLVPCRTRRVKKGDYRIEGDGVVGRVIHRSDDWYAEAALGNFYANGCGDTKLDAEIGLLASMHRNRPDAEAAQRLRGRLVC